MLLLFIYSSQSFVNRVKYMNYCRIGWNEDIQSHVIHLYHEGGRIGVEMKKQKFCTWIFDDAISSI